VKLGWLGVVFGGSSPIDCQLDEGIGRYGLQQTMQATMNTAFSGSASAACLVEIIELKWLLRGHGVHVHVERLQADPEYARHMLDCAASAPNAALREAAARLRCHLGLNG
jgi:hypothetical protein